MALKLISVSLNSEGDSILGSLHCCMDYNTPIDPKPKTNTSNAISLISVLVPSKLTDKKVTVYIEIENDGDADVQTNIFVTNKTLSAVFENSSLQINFKKKQTSTIEMHLTLKAYITEKIYENTWELKYGQAEPSTALGVVNLKTYLLKNLPIEKAGVNAIWDVSHGAYDQQKKNYIWTSLLDICCDACDNFEGKYLRRPSSNENFMQAFVEALNENTSFQYDINELLAIQQ